MPPLPNPRVAAVSLAAVLTLATPIVMHWEGKRNDPYFDLAMVKTVCFGETANVQDRRYTDAECRGLLERSIATHAKEVRRCIPVTAPVEVQAAFVSFGYNVGARAACSSTAVRKLNAWDIRGACDGLMAWVKVRDPKTKQLKFSQGLANRRAAERALCLKGVS